MLIRKFDTNHCFILVFLGVMIGIVITSVVDPSQRKTIDMYYNKHIWNKSIPEASQLPDGVGKIKWLSGMVMTLGDESFKQKYYLDLGANLSQRSKMREKLSTEELMVTYLKRQENIFNSSERERSSPIRMACDIIGTSNSMFPLPSSGNISAAVRELFNPSDVSLDDIGAENEPPRQEKLVSDSRLSVVFAILSTPCLIYSRLLPLLTTSLRDQSAVYVFFRKTNISHLAVEEVYSQLKIFHERFMGGSISAPFNPERVKVVQINGPRDAYITSPAFVRNSWMNMEIIKYLGDRYSAIPFQSRAAEKIGGLEAASSAAGPMENGGRKGNPFSRWFCLLDDDGYVIVPNAKTLLVNATRQIAKFIAHKTSATFKERLGIPQPLIFGLSLVSFEKGYKFNFIYGGCGIFINQAALETIYPRYVWAVCRGKYLYGGGDVRLSACLLGEGAATAVGSLSLYSDTPMKALGEDSIRNYTVIPGSFHRMRDNKWHFRMRQIEDLRQMANMKSTNKGNSILVSWGDLDKNYKMPHLFQRSMFFPRDYSNYTMIYLGKTRKEISSMNKRRGLKPLEGTFINILEGFPS